MLKFKTVLYQQWGFDRWIKLVIHDKPLKVSTNFKFVKI